MTDNIKLRPVPQLEQTAHFHITKKTKNIKTLALEHYRCCFVKCLTKKKVG